MADEHQGVGRLAVLQGDVLHQPHDGGIVHPRMEVEQQVDAGLRVGMDVLEQCLGLVHGPDGLQLHVDALHGLGGAPAIQRQRVADGHALEQLDRPRLLVGLDHDERDARAHQDLDVVGFEHATGFMTPGMGAS